MAVPDGWVICWQDVRGHLKRDRAGESFKSAGSGTEYTSEELIGRLESEIAMMKDGEYPAESPGRTRPAPRIPDNDDNYFLREVIDQEWYDLTSNKDRYDSAGSTTFTQYFQEDRTQPPHQGWKVRVTASPEEGRDVAKAVLPYLQEHDISHKVVQDVSTMNHLEGTRQEGKFITIYPDIDEDRAQIMNEGVQRFKREDPSWNTFSINSNTQNARTIVEDLSSALQDSVAGLQGRSITGDHGEEKQYGDTRIHFRYAHHFNTPAEIYGPDGTTQWVGEHEGLVDKDGDLISGSYIGDQIRSATRPDAFL